MALDVRMEKRRWIWEITRDGIHRFGNGVTISMQHVKKSDVVTGWSHPWRWGGEEDERGLRCTEGQTETCRV